MMVCKLCGKDAVLQDSHIIPEFFFRLLYDSKYRFFELSTDSREKTSLLQKGVREKLLCLDCEQFLSPYEKYAKEVLYERKKTLVNGKWVVVDSVDYSRFKVFQLSLLWRAGVSQLPFFAKVRLAAHEEILRKMLVVGDGGKPHEYGALLMMPITNQGNFLPDLILPPEKRTMDGNTVYIFVMGGISWVILTSSHSDQFTYRNFFLSKDGRLLFHLIPEEKIGIIRGLGSELKSMGKIDAAIALMNRWKKKK